VLAGLDLRWLASHLRTMLPAATSLKLLDRNGTVLVQLPEDGGWVGRRVPDEVLRRAADREGAGAIASTDPENQHRIFGRAPPTANTRDLFVEVGIDRDAAFAPLEAATRRSVALIAAGLALALLAALAGGHGLIRRPVADLLAAAAQWRTGDLSARAGLSAGGGSEIERLGAAFDAMAVELEQREAQRAGAVEALKELNRELERCVAERTREREAALAQAHELQKMESLGQLTGSLAHDFNNLLMAVLGNLRLLRKRLPPDDPRAARMLQGAVEGAERGAALTKRLLAFARRQELRYEPVDVAALVRSMLDLMGRSVGPGVLISTDLPPDLPPVRADANQLELALLNLAVNARDAMPLGGTLAIAVRHALFLPEGAKPQDPRTRAEGGYVVITVRDSGVGMDPETLARAAEPFFTTKGVGQGTGLGLSMVDGLATQSGGALRIESRPNEGTAIRLWLLVAAAAAETASIAGGPLAGAAAEDGPSALHAAWQRCILLVDDDALVLSGTAAMLEDLGHTVTEAASGREALEILRSPARLDLMITDFAMPGMTGVELARSAREARPGLPVILATGFADLRSGSDLGLPRLTKPYGQEDLAARIAEVLGDDDPPTNVVALEAARRA
jgi:signal transduction histidine kinase/ActR/RegA family two-component response regulator